MQAIPYPVYHIEIMTTLRFISTAALILTVWVPFGRSQAQSALPPDAGLASQSSLEEGKRYYELGMYREALPPLQQAVLDNKNSASGHYWLGMALFALNRDAEALKAFKHAVRRDRKWAPGHMGLGLVYNRMPHRRLDARKALRTAMRLDPENAQIQYIMGLTYMDQVDTAWLIGSHQDGRAYFERTVELDPEHPDAFYQLGRCYEELKLADHGKRVRDRYDDYIKALTNYLRQYQVNPDHPETLRKFAGICHRFEYYERGAEQLRKMAEEMEGITPDLIRTMLTQFEALSMSSKKQYDLLQRSLETYIKGLESEEQEIYWDLAHVASPDELAAWEAAKGPARDRLWQDFWNARDPNPATVENERLVEHYKRVMYARIHFSSARFPYDRRGEIYVRYGEPDDRRRFLFRSYEDPRDIYMPTGNPAVDAIREKNWQFGYRLKVDRGQVSVQLEQDTKNRAGFGAASLLTVNNLTADNVATEESSLNDQSEVNYETRIVQRRAMGPSYRSESWVYAAHDMELFFVDQMGGGRFDYPLRTLMISTEPDNNAAFNEIQKEEMHHPQRIAEQLIERSPEDYEHDFGGDGLDYAFDITTFRGNGKKTVMELVYSLPVWQFGDVTDGLGNETFLRNQATLRDTVNKPVLNQKFRFGPIERPKRMISSEQARVSAYTLAVDVLVPSGQFTAAVEMQDETSQRIGVYRKPVSIPDYQGRDLMISGLKMSTGITPTDQTGSFVRKGLNIVPHPLRAYGRGQLVYVYYEIYNLDRDEAGRTSYQTYYEIKPEGMPDTGGRPVDRSGDLQTVVLSYEGEGDTSEEAEYTAIDTTDLTAGVYVLAVTLEDRHSGQRATRTTSFMLLEQ